LSLLAPGCHVLLPLGPAPTAADATDAQTPGDGADDRQADVDGRGPDDAPGPREAAPPTDAVVSKDAAPYDGPETVDAGPPPVLGWSVAAGSNNPDTCRAVAVDSQGNIYAVGYYSKTVDLGGGALLSANGYQVFIASYTPAGAHRWSHGYGGAFQDYGRAVAVDGQDNVYVAGSFVGPTSFGGSPLNSTGYDGFVASYTGATGKHRWSVPIGGSGQDACYGLATHGTKVYVTGVFRGDLPLPSETLTSNGAGDVFLVGLESTTGKVVTAVQIGGIKEDVGWAVAADAAGNLYVGGEISGPANLGGGVVSHHGSSDLFLLSRTGNGLHRWARAYGSPGIDRVHGVAVYGSNVAISGQVGGSLDLGGGPRTAPGSNDVVVASYTTSNGAHRFSHLLGGAGADGGKQLAVDSAGNLYLTGYFSGGSIGGPPLTTAASDVFVISLTGTGAHRWSKAFGSAVADSGLGIAVWGAQVYVGGEHGSALTLDGKLLPHVGQTDLFLVQLK
jgi:hypothetical protein